MKEEYAVLYERSPVGKAELVRQGLYYRISCRYRLPSGEMCRLVVKWPGGWENIGIAVPEKDGFAIVKKIPAKRLPESDISIQLIPLGKDPGDDETKAITEPAVVPIPKMAEEVSEESSSVIGDQVTDGRVPVSEEEPFEQLDRLENARLEIVENEPFAVFEAEPSKLQVETDGTVVGPEDVSIDRSADDLISEPV